MGKTLTDYEMAKWIRKAILTTAASVTEYQSWSDRYCTQELRTLPTEIRATDEFEPIRVENLTEKEMDDLGFGRWSEDDPMRLIPIWLLPYLAEEIPAKSITGEGVIKRSEMDNDHRFGWLAYGVTPNG